MDVDGVEGGTVAMRGRREEAESQTWRRKKEEVHIASRAPSLAKGQQLGSTEG